MLIDDRSNDVSNIVQEIEVVMIIDYNDSDG